MKNNLTVAAVKSLWGQRISQTQAHSQKYLDEKRVDDRLIKSIIKSGVKILDVGCFYPYEAIKLAKHGCLITAIDISKEVVKKAKQVIRNENLSGKIKVELGDATNLKYKNASFDVVIDLTTSVLIPNWPKAINEYHRVLRKEGHLVIVTNNKLQPIAWIELLKQFINNGVHPRWGYFAPTFPWQLKHKLEKNNLKVLKFDAEKLWVSVLPRAIDNFLNPLLTCLAKKFTWLKYLGWRYGFICRKTSLEPNL